MVGKRNLQRFATGKPWEGKHVRKQEQEEVSQSKFTAIGLGLYAHQVDESKDGPEYVLANSEVEGPGTFIFGRVAPGGAGDGYVLLPADDFVGPGRQIADESWDAHSLRVIARFLEYLDYHEGSVEGFCEPNFSEIKAMGLPYPAAAKS